MKSIIKKLYNLYKYYTVPGIKCKELFSPQQIAFFNEKYNIDISCVKVCIYDIDNDEKGNVRGRYYSGLLSSIFGPLKKVFCDSHHFPHINKISSWHDLTPQMLETIVHELVHYAHHVNGLGEETNSHMGNLDAFRAEVREVVKELRAMR